MTEDIFNYPDVIPGGGSSVGPSRLLGVGHSVTTDGGGASYPDNAAWPKTAKLLGATRYDALSKGGASLAMQEGVTIGGSARYGGIARLLQYLSSSLYRTSRPYLPAVELALMMYGLNDMSWMGPTTFQTAFPHALRAAITRLRAGAVFEDTDASVAYTGASWSNVAFTAVNSGAQVKQVNTNGDSLTITVPADFPGGAINLRFATNNNGAGALWTITGTGSCSGVSTTFDTRNINGFDYGGTNAANGKQTNAVKRLTGLPAGAGTIVVTATTVVSPAYFDCWEIESPTPPLVALPLAFRSYSYSAYSTSPYAAISDTDITTVNSAIQSVANEFDAYVFTIATDDLFNKSLAYFENNGASNDQLHPNDLGHDLLTSRFVATINAHASALTLAQPLQPDARYFKSLTGADDVSLVNSWVDYGAPYQPPGYHKDFITGRVTIRGVVKKTTGVFSDTIFTLPVGYRPNGNIAYALPVYTGATWQLGILTISGAGVVSFTSGGSIAAGAGNVINCTFMAEA